MPADTPHPRSRPCRRALRAALVTAFSLAAVSLVQAQAVHKCRIDGRQVFQSAPCPPQQGISAPLAAAANAATAARPAVGDAPKKKTLAELLRERDGADAPRPAIREAQNDGAAVLRTRMGAV